MNSVSTEFATHRPKLQSALEDDEDPLAAFEEVVQLSTKSSPARVFALEQTLRAFCEDPRYSGDLRYLRLWMEYAREVNAESEAIIYEWCIWRKVGVASALLWEAWAASLEVRGLQVEADKAFRTGISAKARPVERLKKRYAEFQARQSPSSRPTPKPRRSFAPSGSSEVDALRKNPFKHFPASALPPPSKGQASKISSASTSATASASSTTLSSTSSASTVTPSSAVKYGHSRYAPMLAPPVPGRRPEKLRFDLSLLFTREGVEYSTAEVRARSMGLLGKKWGPPNPSELPASPVPPSGSNTGDKGAGKMKVNFNDDGTRSTQNMGWMASGKRKSFAGTNEPTVTINTKEALADVFGMYNSPERTVRSRIGVGGKHAPVKKIEPINPLLKPVTPSHPTQGSNENSTPKVANEGFTPFRDENAGSKENSKTPIAKFKPFVDGQGNPPAITPEPGRRALSIKDAKGPKEPSPASETKGTSSLEEGNVFARVFTPVSTKEPLTRPEAAASEVREHLESVFAPPSKDKVDPPPSTTPASGAFKPFVDSDSKTPFKVFSRPGASSENGGLGGNIFTPKPSAFKPLRDSKRVLTQQEPVGDAPRAFKPFQDGGLVSSTPAQGKNIVGPSSDVSSSDDQAEFADEGGFVYTDAEGQPSSVSSESQFEDEYQEVGEEAVYDIGEEDEDEEDDRHRQPLGGRFGAINVMTPITERTFEYTRSTAGFLTPHGTDAVEAAEQLAAELREDNEQEQGQRYGYMDEDGEDEFNPPNASAEFFEDRTGTLSLGDTLALVSSFKPPNPCNPFDPAIMSKVLSLLPLEQEFYDLRDEEAGMLGDLQRFAAKKTKRGGSSGRGFDDDSGILMSLGGKAFKVTEKLGEGGFGSVFAARDLKRPAGEDEDEDDFDLDDDDDEDSKVALKVVKPRNLWEFHVLRRIHRTVPEAIRRTIIYPLSLHVFRDESYLSLPLCSQGSLLDIVNRASSAGISQQGACLDELLVFFFTIELLRFLEGMHSSGFIHGDLKIDNCLLRLEDIPLGDGPLAPMYGSGGEGNWRYKGLAVIDFGRAIDTALFPRSQRFVGDWSTDARDCRELRDGRPWTYQTDYFGLAGIIYCMLFGKYIEDSALAPTMDDAGRECLKIATPFKRYWQSDLWTRLFHILLNSAQVGLDGQLPLCEELAEIRQEMEAWLQANCNRSSNTLRGLLKKIEVSLFS
ncbi:hypothetical protein CONPUDRAFT_120008 [Coniophora puteana RWD-64-598 SS2]|uniref:Kinase-like protein n=1 Tax=Coniophora puteana (strain RWD-64-598) TaxID=741705 RepID=A0A5M3MYP9_CONPW|nr:uncharacterized protein CONPUDRAFT_120008 [Coniophora puteana RWD-64-598 SS2]EIW84278.1 hypothetical protein CONPUDRAFT_120008 [Coniophora puteana RWD-64-598 SS2]